MARGLKRQTTTIMTSRRDKTLALAVGGAIALGALIALIIFLTGGSGETTTTTVNSDRVPALGRPIGGSTSARPQPPANAGAAAAARAFFGSYLAVSYGRAKPEQLRNATAALRETLRDQNARVPVGVEDLRPRIVSVRLEAIGDGRVRATGTVEDGDVAPYPLFATLARIGERWVAVSVGG